MPSVVAHFISFLVPALLIVFAALVWRASPNRQLNRSFTSFTAVTAVWAVAVTAAHDGWSVAWCVPISFAAGSLIPVTFLQFMQAYRPAGGVRARARLVAFAATGIVFSALSLTTDLVIFDPSLNDGSLSRRSGPLYPLFALFIVSTWGTAVAVFLSKGRAARGRARAELQYLAAGMVVPGIGVIVTNVLMPWLTGRSAYGAIGPYFALSFVAVIGHALIRHRITDLRLVLHNGLTVAIATVLASLPALVLLLVFWPRLLGHLPTGELVVVLTLVALVLALIAPTRDLTRRLLDQYLYRTHANYQQTVRDASRALTGLLDLKKLLSFITGTITGSTGAEGVAVYLKQETDFSLAIKQTPQGQHDFQTMDAVPPEVVFVLNRSKDAVAVEELGSTAASDSDRRLAELLTAANWSLLLPIIYEENVIGLIAVGPKLSGDPFYSQDLDLLMTLANQAGIAVKNAQLYAEVVLAHEYIENIVATIESGVIAINSAGRVAMFNRAAERLTGLGADATVGEPAAGLPTCLAQPLLASVEDGQARTVPEVDLAGADATRPVICTTSPLRGPEGRVLGAVAVFSDLTPLKQLEIERRRAERLAYFEVLASGIAHEIKNPLVAIKTFAQLVPRRREDPRFVEEFGRIVGREIHRMERLVERLRTLAREGRRPRHALDVRGPLMDALEFMQATFDEKRIAIHSALGEAPCPVIGNPEELEELFLNLLMNAHEATPPGGAVRVEIAHDERQASVTVADTGPGIPPDLLERIFEPFFSTKQRGSGLGLAISAGVAQSHGARLRAANGPSGGALLVLEFPLTPVSVMAIS